MEFLLMCFIILFFVIDTIITLKHNGNLKELMKENVILMKEKRKLNDELINVYEKIAYLKEKAKRHKCYSPFAKMCFEEFERKNK